MNIVNNKIKYIYSKYIEDYVAKWSKEITHTNSCKVSMLYVCVYVYLINCGYIYILIVVIQIHSYRKEYIK